MNQEHPLIQEAARIFAELAEVLKEVDTPLVTATGLPKSQIRVLYLLYYEKEANVGQLAKHLDVGLPTASYHVDQMVEAGLVERMENKTDRRSKVIRLTPEGRAIINSFFQASLDQMTLWLTRLPTDDLMMLIQGLRSLAEVSQAIAGNEPG
jgi:DNA-binding MarR family transcriptional regulator